MKCVTCGRFERRNTWTCRACGSAMKGGVVFVTGISGTGTDTYLRRVLEEAKASGHDHEAYIHDIGRVMQRFAEDDDPDVNWDRILDADKRMLRSLRARAFQELVYAIRSQPEALHIVDLHLSFRWFSYLTRGFDPHILSEFVPYTRSFINLIEDLAHVQERLEKSAWGDRNVLELLIWRDEELFLTTLFADIFGRVDCYSVLVGEPPSTLEKLIWHPEQKKVYLSFPITNILHDPVALAEVESFRDHIREFLIVFDPYASHDYDEAILQPAMSEIIKEVGEVVVDKDYRFIDQADAIVVYYPKLVPSKGVDAEMNYARRTGKPIYLYCPEELRGGPFVVPPTHFRSNATDFINLLRSALTDQAT
jgi:adenylate kinase